MVSFCASITPIFIQYTYNWVQEDQIERFRKPLVSHLIFFMARDILFLYSQ